MNTSTARVLLLSDTHLGFDLPRRPRIVRRRRGHDFFDNYTRALQPALDGEVDVVVHGGDLLYRSRVPASLVQAAMEPLFRVADAGVPVYLVPGNHERGQIPYPLLTRHPGVHIFDRPRTFLTEVRGLRVALTGFPYEREVGRIAMAQRLRTRGAQDADVRLACFHQLVEGSRVEGYTFRRGPDVIPAHGLPAGYAAFLTGHVHRSQVLTCGPSGRALTAPVLYPGSIERTSFAERNERKGYLTLRVAAGPRPGGTLVSWRFHELPARPMVDLRFEPLPGGMRQQSARLRSALSALSPDAVVRLHVRDASVPQAQRVLAADNLRRLAPPTMNVSVVMDRYPRPRAG